MTNKEIMNKKKNLSIALYQIENPDNFGAIIRTCTCFDINLIVIKPMQFIFNRDIYKTSSLDYMCNMEYYISFKDFYTKNQHRRILLFTPHSSANFSPSMIQDNDILLFGRESCGVPNQIAARCDFTLSIPMNVKVRSLNLAMCVSIVCFQVF